MWLSGRLEKVIIKNQKNCFKLATIFKDILKLLYIKVILVIYFSIILVRC